MAHLAGIDALIAVTQMKVDNANNAAMDGATKQRKLVNAEAKLHAEQARFEEAATKAKSDGLSAGEANEINGLVAREGGVGNIHAGKSDASADKGSTEYKNDAAFTQARDFFDKKDKDLQNEDKLGNFEIQGLMSEFNEAQTLSSSVLKKKDDAGNAVIQKI